MADVYSDEFSRVAMRNCIWGMQLLIQLLTYARCPEAAENIAENSFLSRVNEENRYSTLSHQFVDENAKELPKYQVRSPFHDVYSLKRSNNKLQRVHYAADENGPRANFHSNFASSDNSFSNLPWSETNVRNVPSFYKLPPITNGRHSNVPGSDIPEEMTLNDFRILPKWIASLSKNDDQLKEKRQKESLIEGFPYSLSTEKQLLNDDTFYPPEAFNAYGRRQESEATALVNPVTTNSDDSYNADGSDSIVSPHDSWGESVNPGIDLPNPPKYNVQEFPNDIRNSYLGDYMGMTEIDIPRLDQTSRTAMEDEKSSFTNHNRENQLVLNRKEYLHTKVRPQKKETKQQEKKTYEQVKPLFTQNGQNITLKAVANQNYNSKSPVKKEVAQKLEKLENANGVSPIFDILNDNGRFYYYVLNKIKPADNSFRFKSKYYSTGDALIKLLNETGVSYKKNDFLFAELGDSIKNYTSKMHPSTVYHQGGKASKNTSDSQFESKSQQNASETPRNMMYHLKKMENKHAKNKSGTNQEKTTIFMSPLTTSDTPSTIETEATTISLLDEPIHNSEERMKTNHITKHQNKQRISNEVYVDDSFSDHVDQNVVFITLPELALDLQAHSDTVSTTPSSVNVNETTGAKEVSAQDFMPTTDITITDFTTNLLENVTSNHVSDGGIETTSVTSQTSTTTVDTLSTTIADESGDAISVNSIIMPPDIQPSLVSNGSDVSFQNSLENVSLNRDQYNDTSIDESKVLALKQSINLNTTNDLRYSKNGTSPIISKEMDPMMVVQVKNIEDLMPQLLDFLKDRSNQVENTKKRVTKNNTNTFGIDITNSSFEKNKASSENDSKMLDTHARNVILEKLTGNYQMDAVLPSEESKTIISAHFPENKDTLINTATERSGFEQLYRTPQNLQVVSGIPNLVIVFPDQQVSSLQPDIKDSFTQDINRRQTEIGNSPSDFSTEYKLLHRDTTGGLNEKDKMKEILQGSSYTAGQEENSAIFRFGDQLNDASGLGVDVLQNFYADVGLRGKAGQYDGNLYDHAARIQAESQINGQTVSLSPELHLNRNNFMYANEMNKLSFDDPFKHKASNDTTGIHNIEFVNYDSGNFLGNSQLNDNHQFGLIEYVPEQTTNDAIEIVEIIDYGPDDFYRENYELDKYIQHIEIADDTPKTNFRTNPYIVKDIEEKDVPDRDDAFTSILRKKSKESPEPDVIDYATNTFQESGSYPDEQSVGVDFVSVGPARTQPRIATENVSGNQDLVFPLGRYPSEQSEIGRVAESRPIYYSDFPRTPQMQEAVTSYGRRLKKS